MPSSVRPSRSSQPSTPRDVRILVAPEELNFRDWPLVDRPLASLAAIGLAAGMGGLAGWAARTPLVGAAVAVFLMLLLWRTWLPTHYELSGSGISMSVLGWRRRVPWTAIQNHEIKADGVLLVPDAALTSLSPLRGIYLHWGSHQSGVLSHLDYYLRPWNAGRGNSNISPPPP